LLLKKIEAERILYFAFDKYSLDKTPEAFIFLIKNYFERRLKKKVFEIDFKVYLFIDEIQYIDFWQDIVKRYYDQNKNIKFIITQTLKLKGKSKESLAGRIIEYYLSTLDYEEFLMISRQNCTFKSVWNYNFFNDDYEELFDFYYQYKEKLERNMPIYLCYGQFPEISMEKDIEFGYKYIKESVLGKILEHDIPNFYGVEKVQIFKNLAYHLITNSSSIFEIQNIGRELGISKKTAEKYLSYLTEGFLLDILYKCLKSSIKKGRSTKKSYASSTNFIASINNIQLEYYDKLPHVFGKIVETYVHWRLTRKFKNVCLWRSGNKEVDFVIPAEDIQQKLFIEVKFSEKIRNNSIKFMLSMAKKKNLSKTIFITKNLMDKQEVSGIKIFFIPYFLI